MVTQGRIRVVRSGGSKLNYRRPVFSADGKYLMCVSGDFIKVYSTSTEECIHTLQGHDNLVTGIELNPKNHLQLYSCSLDGTIKLWDFIDGILIKTFLIGCKCLTLYTSDTDELLFAVTLKKNNGSTASPQLVSVKLPKSTSQECEAKDISVIFEDVSHLPKCTAIGRQCLYVASVKGLHLSIYYFKTKKCFRLPLKSTSKKGANNIFTVVACHPKEDCIATGHMDGRIRLWRNFNHKQGYVYSSLHWHHDSVMDLTFSAQGTKLLSGGVESVLVQWPYGSEEKKEFLPRLGAAIEHISTSPHGTLYCTSHEDNKISIIDTSLKVSGIIQGLLKGTVVKTGLVVDPRSNALVLNGKPGHLQFYSLHNDRHLYNLDIVQQEFIHQAGLQYMDLVKALFNSTGKWLATVEELQGGEDSRDLEMQMKFWEYQDKSQSFVLNTIISRPHEDHITSLCFRDGVSSAKDSPTLVTTGKDGIFKVWVLNNNYDIYKQSNSWCCDFVGSYHKNKATNCCFSEDGSLLAVSFDEIITVWESSTWDLKQTFCQPPGKIRNLCFGRMSCSKYLVASTNDGFIYCWNLLTCALEWRAQLDAAVLQPDPLSENIAVISCPKGSSNLFLFQPTDPRPFYAHKNVCREKVQWAVFVPKEIPEFVNSESHQWLNKSQLYFLTENQDLLTFSSKSTEERLTPLSKQLAVEESLPVTPFHLLLCKKRQEEQEKLDVQLVKAAPSFHRVYQDSAIREVLHTPAHVLPSASVLCTIFVNSLLISRKSQSTEELKDEEMESEHLEGDSTDETEEVESQNTFPSAFSLDVSGILPKVQEKELRKIRRTDYSWLSSL
uniref:LOC734119 protein n=1 Tax=Xenopus tropicalis TaxID=8364 RepID=B5DDW0_XENTR|nr:LOC734119 protein [Xenopus tropicalis]